MTIYDELRAAIATVLTIPPEHPTPEHLLLEATRIPDTVWGKLSPAAQAWCNEAAEKLNTGENVRECPGYGPSKAIGVIGMTQAQAAAFKQSWDAAAKGDMKITHVALVDRPPDPYCITAEGHGLSAAMSTTGQTNTDRVRAVVIEHPEWNQAQIAEELERRGIDVSAGTIATVRSVTLSTINIAKRLGKWKEGQNA
jgi:hypothetical protein